MRCKDLVVVIGLVAAAGAAVRPATACGPDFQIELLADRETTMAELPEGIFVDEVAQLVLVDARFRDPCHGHDSRCVAPGGMAPGAIEAALYADGAAAFHAGDRARATSAFTALLGLPGPMRRQLSTSAAYSLGRLHVDDHGRGSYRRVRALVAAGFVDPDGLAAASLRNEAVLTDEVSAEVELGAQRAALGHRDAKDRLLAIVRAAIREGTEDALLATATGQRLIAAYLYARSAELTEGETARVWAALGRLPHVAGADRLAAARYRQGDWAGATTLVALGDDTPLARWVRAKLAARTGDVAAAADLACSAAEALPITTDCPDFVCGDYLPRDRALVECAGYELSAERAPSAMRHAWAARRSYRDALYIAERVLTLAELRGFLDELFAHGFPHDPGDLYWDYVSIEELRTMYGRRLMRAGRSAEALPWLRLADIPSAVTFADALDRAERGDRFAQAEALFRASMIARTAGMEILGTAHGPDWAIEDGGYDVDTYTDGPDTGRAGYQPPWDAETEDTAPPRERSPWVGADERARVDASAPSDERRFHYRYRAVELARAALERVPTWTQAHDAIACWVDQYPQGQSSEYLYALRDHVIAGAAFPDEGCPDPDFAAARHAKPPPPRVAPRRDFWARHPRVTARVKAAVPIAAAAVAALAALGVIALLYRRARRRAAVP